MLDIIMVRIYFIIYIFLFFKPDKNKRTVFVWDIISCVPKFYSGYPVGSEEESKDATSMAAPHIAALAAMIKLENPSITAGEVENVIVSHCVDFESDWEFLYEGHFIHYVE